MKIVITGGAGFIGSHIAEYWNSKGAEVAVIDNLRSGYIKNIIKLNNVVLHNISITDKESVNRIIKEADFVFNLAAMISVPESIEKPTECVDINILGLINVLDACVKGGVRKLIHTSSAAIYGDNPVLPKKENLLPEPKSPYGVTKLDGEYYLNIYSENYGLKTTSLRYFNVYGPRQDPKSQYAAAIPIFIFRALKNMDITIYGDGSQTRDFIYVKDIVKANVLAAESNQKTGLYNVANGSAISILELAQKIINVTGSKSKILFAAERAGDIKHSIASIEAIRLGLGFEADYNLDEGLKQTIEYFSTI